MTRSQKVLHSSLEHPAAALCTIAFAAAGQLVLPWALAKATRAAEQMDLRSPAYPAEPNHTCIQGLPSAT